MSADLSLEPRLFTRGARFGQQQRAGDELVTSGSASEQQAFEGERKIIVAKSVESAHHDPFKSESGTN